MRDLIEKISRGAALSLEEARRAALEMLRGVDEVVAAALLMGMRVRGESSEEIAGFAGALRETCVRIELGELARSAVDTAGTGGDGLRTLNASTAAALVAAYLGAVVVKHGNRSVSSSSGSADFIEALGFELSAPPERLSRMARELRFAFAFAPSHHVAMRNVMSVRRRLGVRTIFNLAGPLSNPAFVSRQVIGVAERSLLERVAEAASLLGYDLALVVHGEPGVDEVSVFGATEVVEVRRGSIERFALTPADLGLRKRELGEVRVESARHSVERFRRAVLGSDEAARDFIAANAAAALYVAGIAKDLRDGVELALSRMDGGLLSYVDELAEASRSL
ncbi:MAG: anthranilate phosphoribosyltransferase [Fervidicoccaceae archaeon]